MPKKEWATAPAFLDVFPRLQEITLRLNRLALAKQIQRDQATLLALKGGK